RSRKLSELSVRRLLRSTAAIFVLRPGLVILVMPFPPETAILVATFRCAIEPLIHSPESIHSARVSRVSVINNSVLERERAHSGTLARVSVNVGPRRGREFGRPLGSRAR